MRLVPQGPGFFIFFQDEVNIPAVEFDAGGGKPSIDLDKEDDEIMVFITTIMGMIQ